MCTFSISKSIVPIYVVNTYINLNIDFRHRKSNNVIDFKIRYCIATIIWANFNRKNQLLKLETISRINFEIEYGFSCKANQE